VNNRENHPTIFSIIALIELQSLETLCFISRVSFYFIHSRHVTLAAIKASSHKHHPNSLGVSKNPAERPLAPDVPQPTSSRP